jgi:hypothetical protein
MQSLCILTIRTNVVFHGNLCFVCEGICCILQFLHSNKEPSSLPLWSSSTITNPYIPVVFNFHRLYHRPSTFLFL